MLIYFHQNKFRYEKGQLAPFFILALVALLVMAMVTVNLSKVASIKTDSSNAVDSGALAAGSVMANIFNAVAQQNSQMEAQYWEFYAAISVLFTAAIASLAVAMTMACIESCAAIGALAVNRALSIAIGLSIMFFGFAQTYRYLSLRNTAETGRRNAIQIGHQFNFTNSGIGPKLKEGSPPANITDPGKRNGYRDMFNQFLAGIGNSPEYTYSWLDGEDRGHFISSKVTIDEVGTFELQVTVLPGLAITALLIASTALAFGAMAALILACGFQKCCQAQVENVGCCMGWTAECATAKAEMAGIAALMAAAWAGLLPGWTFSSGSNYDSIAFMIAWIDDIEHNRLVRVDTTQHHEGTDLGLWQITYPDARSYSVVSFQGKGQIYPPVLRHDASIIRTD